MDADEVAALLGGGAVTELRRLSGGASRQTWSFRLGGRPLILQRQRPGGSGLAPPMATEVAVLRAAAGAGVPVPTVVHDATDADPPAFVVEHVEGETIARRLLRDDEYAGVRPTLAAACGRALAAVHRIPPEAVGGLRDDDALDTLRATYDPLAADDPHPAFELGFRWLAEHRPPAAARRRTVVHGDFRTGNLIVGPDGVRAVIDWELVHVGDPLEDLGWFCVRAWRFGADDRPAGGFGSREDLWRAYEEAGGGPVDPDAARWWEAFGTLRWGVICMVQAATHRLGLSRSVELAAIGPRTHENEHDLLALLPGGPMPPATPVDAPAPRPPHRAAELVEAVREWIVGDVAAAAEGRVRFHARVAANALAIVERELALGPAHAAAHAARLTALGVADDAALAAAIRAGDLDDRWDEVRAAVWSAARDRLAVTHPGYDDRGP